MWITYSATKTQKSQYQVISITPTNLTIIILNLSTGEVDVINVTTTSALITWVIPRFTQAEEYYIQYGTEETMLDVTTDSIPSPSDTSLVNQTYSITLQGLRPSTIYYFRVAAVYDSISTRYSELSSFRTYEEGTKLKRIERCLLKLNFFLSEQVIYLPFLNHTDTYIRSGVLSFCDDCSSTEIMLPDYLPFGGSYHQSAYVSVIHACRVK